MACPKCGGQSTEYDQHKWTCLKCGNKFIYAPQPSSQTHNFVQNTVNVVGQPTYELDAQNAKPATPIIKTRLQSSPEEFQHLPKFDQILDHILIRTNDSRVATASQVIRQRRTDKKIILYSTCCLPIFIIAATVSSLASRSQLSEEICGWFGTFALCCIFLLMVGTVKIIQTNPLLKKIERQRQELEEQIKIADDLKQQEVITGYKPICPYCMAEVVNASKGLSHCLECGKQFHYSNENSYPIRSKQN